MSGIVSAGIGSGLDITGLVGQLVQSDGAPQLNRLNTKEAKLQAQLSAMGTLKGSLSDFQNAMSGLSDMSSFQSLTASSANTTLYTANADANATTGTHSVEVKELAAAHRIASKAFSDTTSAIGTGTITFQFGTYNSTANTFTANASKSSSSVTIDGANNSLEGIRSAVNSANIGVSASIVNDGSGSRLVFASASSGAANSLQVTVGSDSDSNSTDDAGLSQFAYDPTSTAGSGKNMSQTIAAQDASLTVDGLAITSATNTVTGTIPGVTLNLLSKSAGSPATLSVSRNTSTITTNVQNFVTKYNALASTIKNLGSYDSTNKTGGVLLGDSTLRDIDNQIRSKVSTVVSNLGGGYNSLASIGITTQKDGTLSLNSSTLSAALNTDPDAVGRIFSSGGNTSDALVTQKRSTSSTKEGDYAINITQAAAQGFYTGTAPTSPTLTIDGTNNTFSLKVNGAQSASITLTQKTYASNADLAVEMQTRINGDSSLKAAGVSVAVNYDTDHFSITSNAYGAGSKISVTAVNTNTAASLGLSVGNGTDGKNVTGTIGGQAATGFGQLLTGSTGNSVGLQVEVRGSAIGNRGNVTFSRGIADQLSTMISGFLDTTTGTISSRTDDINTSIKSIGEQRTTVNTRLASLQKQYLTQFNAMDSIVASMKSTGTFLTQQFAQKTSN
ncbi:flagellar hook-associated protein 2 [Gammaproteobacteria bacterium]